jgi:predicted ester cyclase
LRKGTGSRVRLLDNGKLKGDECAKETGMDPQDMRLIDDGVKDAIAAGDLDAFDRLMSPELAALAGLAVTEIKAAFPDYAGTNEIQIVEGDMIATRWVFHGTHQGDYYGVAPTGKQVTFTGISISRFAEGRMVDTIIESDEVAVLRQLGQTALPPDN